MAVIATDPDESPEHMILRIQRRRTTQLVLLVVGLVAAVVVALGTTALMFADGPNLPAQTR